MTPRDRAENIVERFLSTPEGFAPDNKQALIAAIEQGMNEVLEDAATKLKAKEMHIWLTAPGKDLLPQFHEGGVVAFRQAVEAIRALKSPDTPRNTITDNQKD